MPKLGVNDVRRALKTIDRWLRSSLRIALSTSSRFFATVGRFGVASRLATSLLGSCTFSRFGTQSIIAALSSRNNSSGRMCDITRNI